MTYAGSNTNCARINTTEIMVQQRDAEFYCHTETPMVVLAKTKSVTGGDVAKCSRKCNCSWTSPDSGQMDAYLHL